MTKAFIFDMDGVIVDSEMLHKKIWHKFLAKYGIKVSEDTIAKFTRGKSAEDTISLFLADKFSRSQIKKLAKEKREMFLSVYQKKITPISGVIEFIQKAKTRKFILAIASSGGKRRVGLTIEKIGLKDLFAAIVTAEMIKISKPHPEIYNKTAKLLKIDPKNCIVFEDAVNGVEAAHWAGMNVIFIKSSSDQVEVNKNHILFEAKNFTNPQILKLLH